MLLSNFSRLMLPSSSLYLRQSISTLYTTTQVFCTKTGYVNEQMNYIRSALENHIDDWGTVRNKTLSLKGSINETNIDGVIIKVMLSSKNLDSAYSFVNFLKQSGNNLNLGVINGIFALYYEMAKVNPLGEKEKQFILDMYKTLYEKYEVLDYATCERLLHALCAIGEWEKALKVLDDIHVTSKPSFSAYNTLIATLFNVDNKKEALQLIQRSVCNQRSLQHIAYEAWINYVLRKYKDKNRRAKYLDEICIHIFKNFATIPEETAQLMRKTYVKLGWNARYTKIRKQDGQCVYCRTNLDCLKLTNDEFQLLQNNVKDKLIVGSDILLKTSPEELKRFTDFVKKTAPYDIVLDALNICYAVGKFKTDKVGPLTYVVEHFRQQNKKILLVGRKHMLRWPHMKYLLSKTCSFFTEDESQDDPYFITAAILSGSNTDFVSKDLLRGHRFQMQDEQLRYLFQRWQWQHQWKVFMNKHGSPFIHAPLSVTPCAQKKSENWHIPFVREDQSDLGQIRDGTPDWNSWLCLQPIRIGEE